MLKVESHTVSHYFKGQSGTTVVMITLDGVPVSGATVVADYYKPDNSPFLSDQSFTEIGTTGLYCHDFDIHSDADEGVYKVKIHALYEVAGSSFNDEFTEPDGPASNWLVHSGDWAIVSNVYEQTRLGYYNTALIDDPDAFNWADYTFEADVRWDSTGNGELGIYGRYVDDGKYYRLTFDPDWDGGKLVLRQGGTHLANADYPFAYPSAWFTMKMVFSGNNIKCYVNDVLLIEHVDGSPIESGKIGLYAGGIAASFDNVHVVVQGESHNSYQMNDFIVESTDLYKADVSDIPTDAELDTKHGAGSWETGGGGSDWGATEREQIRDALGIDGAKTKSTGGVLQKIRAIVSFIRLKVL